MSTLLGLIVDGLFCITAIHFWSYYSMQICFQMDFPLLKRMGFPISDKDGGQSKIMHSPTRVTLITLEQPFVFSAASSVSA
ncbi:hypothetical protein EB796_007410 [Bugula neritina]|uniref:Uncharacterized protein n=1 Tax=Bugula neritina TaxID=10212 RepID=A0A7J7K9Q9_BUGNE|nr:hypothetical protein EB796_007410 [Bugula neritina]